MEKRTEITSLGEFGLINHLTGANESVQASTVKAVGDDAAVIDIGANYGLLATDMLVEGVHFDLSYVPLKHLGYKAVTVNLSDLYAMNAHPTQITVSIAFSNRFSLEAIEEIYEGIYKACAVYGVDLVGGDTSSSLSGLMLSISVFGTAEKDKVVYRTGAKEGDLIVVTGDLGGAFMGLQMLEREKTVFTEAPAVQPDLTGKEYILERQLKPEARKDIIQMFETMGLKPTSMIDISDGLASELFHLTTANDLGCTIYEEKIPIDKQTYDTAREFNLDPTVCALNGGEDYELLFSISQTDYDKIKGGPHFTPIGHYTDKSSGKMLVTKGGSVTPLEAQGWVHHGGDKPA